MTGLLSEWVGRRRRRQEMAALRVEVPLAADLLAMALGAGLTPYLALEVAARYAPSPLAVRFAAVLGAARERRLVDALEDETSASPPLGAVLRVLIASERLGAPAAPSLVRLAAEGRARARQEAMTRARTVPVRLLFPLVFLVLPAFLVLTVAPVLLAGFAH
ncbi:MAG: type II secretion system F family protein [Actinomycetota bacterium]|nr:type II secretion system F family protein [Actinomycetota bacterium]